MRTSKRLAQFRSVAGGPSARLFGFSMLVAACTMPPAAAPPATPRVGADSARDEIVAPGIRHQYLWHASGPWAIHLVEVDIGACIVLRSAKAEGRVIGREKTSAMAQTVQAATGRPVLLGVNADFFSFDPPGRPEAAQVSDGVIVKSDTRLRNRAGGGAQLPVPVFVLDPDQRPRIAAPTFEGTARVRGVALSLHTVNAPPPPNGLALYNAYIGPETPLDSGVIELIVRPLGHAMVGDRVSGIVQSVDTAAAGVAFASELVVLSARGSTAAQLRAAGSGDTVQWLLSFPTAGERIRELIGGFPPLLRSGRTVYRDEYDLLTSFSEGRHPRSAIGWRADGTLLILTVDGRQPGYSEGMTLEELASYMQTLGAREALNLDGGGSTTLVLSGRVVNRPSDAEGERAVANALLVLGPLPGAC